MRLEDCSLDLSDSREYRMAVANKHCNEPSGYVHKIRVSILTS